MIPRRTFIGGTAALAGAGLLPRAASAANPIVPGWYADPEIHVIGDRYWIYCTLSEELSAPADPPGLSPAQQAMRRGEGIRPAYLGQQRMDAWSSADLVTWTYHPRIIDLQSVSWAGYALWAPSMLEQDGRYHLFFSANDIKTDAQTGGMGIAVADRPEGPFRDMLGAPLIGVIRNGAQPIDPYAFRDDDGQVYLFYGGWGHCNVVRLSADLRRLEPHADGSTFKEITPENYVEGSFMLKRSGRYYFMWSEGGWTGPDYSVAYAIGDSPTGPFRRVGKILQQDLSVARGAGHHSVLNLPGTDDWIIAYHRRPLGTDKGDERVLSLERMIFEDDGTIRPVQLTHEGLPPTPLPRRG